MRFQFLKENQKRYNIRKACKVLKISRSGFYHYLRRPKSKRAIENEALIEIIEEIFHEHQGRYGARRIQKVLEKRTIRVNHKRISRLMSKQGLRAKGAKKKFRNHAHHTQYEERKNLLNQVFNAQKKNLVWVGDITYIPTRQGFLYLAVFIDVFSRKVVGWSMNTRLKDSLVLAAFYQAIGREQPEKGLIVHTDRGSQYTSHRFGALLTRYQCVQSMSRKGNPYDNAVMESFYKTLKRELVKGAKYDHPDQAGRDIFRYIETYYNTKRMHSSLGYLSPREFESKTP